MSLGATGLAGRYASALYALADDTGNVNEIVADLTDLAKLVADNDDIKMLISSPALTRSEQLAGITAITKKAAANAMTVKFLGTLAENGRLYALRRSDGVVRWVTALDGALPPGVMVSEDAPRYFGPVVAGGRVYLLSDGGTLHGFDADTGDEVKTLSVGGRVSTAPQVAAGKMFVLGSNGTLTAFE